MFVLYIIYFVVLNSYLGVYTFHYTSQYNNEEFQITTNFYDYVTESERSEAFSIEIDSPTQLRSATKEISKFPVCILLYGDNVQPFSLYFVKNALKRQHFITVMIKIPHYSYRVMHILNATLNFVAEHPYVDLNRIAIFGHSRGAHYAYHFANERSDLISAVVAGNVGSFDLFFNDYVEYYLHTFNLGLSWSERLGVLDQQYSEEIKYDPIFQNMRVLTQNPKNVLIITDQQDKLRNSSYDAYLSHLFPIENAEINQEYGDFGSDCAMALKVSKSSLGHLASIILPENIYESILWFSQSLEYNFPRSISPQQFRIWSWIEYLALVCLLFCIIATSIYQLFQLFLGIRNHQPIEESIESGVLWFFYVNFISFITSITCIRFFDLFLPHGIANDLGFFVIVLFLNWKIFQFFKPKNRYSSKSLSTLSYQNLYNLSQSHKKRSIAWLLLSTITLLLLSIVVWLEEYPSLLSLIMFYGVGFNLFIWIKKYTIVHQKLFMQIANQFPNHQISRRTIIQYYTMVNDVYSRVFCILELIFLCFYISRIISVIAWLGTFLMILLLGYFPTRLEIFESPLPSGENLPKIPPIGN